MTKVGQVNQELKVVAQQNEETQVEGTNVDTQLREAFNSDQVQGNQLTKLLKAQDLNFENFPKGNRLDAPEFAGRSLNEVKDAAREFNADFPKTLYVVDYSEFPKPETFPKKNYGGKEEAYNAWKDAVTEWVEDCKQDMVAKKSNHIGSMTEKFERAMNRGFFNIYIQAGITRDFIQATYEALNGDINKVKEQLNAKAEEIKKHTTTVGRNVINKVNANTNKQVAGLHQHITNSTNELHEHLDKNTQEIKEHVDDTANSLHNKINDSTSTLLYNIDQNAQETQEVVIGESRKLQKQEKTSQQINALSVAISTALHDWQDVFRTDETLGKVEDLKMNIIKSNKVNDNKKLELLGKLLELVNNDSWITQGNLDAIVTNNLTIIANERGISFRNTPFRFTFLTKFYIKNNPYFYLLL